MLDHVSIPTEDFEASAAFYDSVLATLGLVRRKQRPGAIGYGPPERPAPIFWILKVSGSEVAKPGIGLHISFESGSRDAVDRFHAAGLKNGGTDAGSPGMRPQYTAPFYGAFLLDPNGFKIEAVCRHEDS